MNDLLLIPVIFLAVGGILILLWRLFLIASGLFLIGFISFLIFVEVYGIYLFFTEPPPLYGRFIPEWSDQFYRILCGL